MPHKTDPLHFFKLYSFYGSCDGSETANEEDILRILREIKVNLNSGSEVASACRHAGISDKFYHI